MSPILLGQRFFRTEYLQGIMEFFGYLPRIFASLDTVPTYFFEL
jgi:hypothetical protein